MIDRQQEEAIKYSVSLDRLRLTRRTLLKRAFGAGLISVIVMPGTSCENPPITITWMSEADIAVGTAPAVLRSLVDWYNLTNEDGIQVKPQPGMADSTQLHHDIAMQLQKGNGYPEVLSIDVDWVAEFAYHQWIKPIDDRWPKDERSHYLPQAIKAATFNNRIWAAPFRTDVGLLYYRTDLGIVDLPPKTWEELTREAQKAMKARKINYGYVWQGAQYEGLVCCFLEVLSSYSVPIYDPIETILKNSSAVEDTLNQMKSWVGVGGISHDVTGFGEDDAREQWIEGHAAFMRHWPYAIAPSNARGSNVAGNYQLAPLPSQAKACLGGWHLAINASASPERQDAAWKFIHWMLQPDAQMHAAREGALAGTLKDIYTNT